MQHTPAYLVNSYLSGLQSLYDKVQNHTQDIGNILQLVHDTTFEKFLCEMSAPQYQEIYKQFFDNNQDTILLFQYEYYKLLESIKNTGKLPQDVPSVQWFAQQWWKDTHRKNN